jgi:hypothetical protein
MVGDTFGGAVEDGGIAEIDPGAKMVDVAFRRGTGRTYTLSDSYFSAGIITTAENRQGESLVASYVFVEPGTLRLNLDNPVGEGIHVVLEFPDQRRFSRCVHEESDDVTVLTIDVARVETDGGAAGPLTVSFRESVRLGKP